MDRGSRKFCYDKALDAARTVYQGSIEDVGKYIPADLIARRDNSDNSDFEKKLKDSKIFWIDSMTMDSLINFPPSVETIRNFDFKMPFSSIFFELEGNPIYKYVEKDERWSGPPIGGLLMKCKSPSEISPGRLDFAAFSAIRGGDVAAVNYIQNGNITIIEALPGVSVNGQIFSKTNAYAYDPRSSIFVEVQGGSTSTKPLLRRIEMETPDDDCLNAIKLANLGINAIQYINAQNVIYRQRNRTEHKTVVQNIYEGKNRRKLKKRKNRNIEIDLKPYYWIEVKKDTKYIDRRQGDYESTLNCRFWVRGHNRYYCDVDGNEKYHRWIEPYVKGPEGAPFKENRYEVLYKRFKPLLENPQLRQGPWSMSDLNKELVCLKENKYSQK